MCVNSKIAALILYFCFVFCTLYFALYFLLLLLRRTLAPQEAKTSGTANSFLKRFNAKDASVLARDFLCVG